jgi:transposase-like protein
MAKEKSPLDQMLDDLLKGKSPKEILGQHGLLDELTKRLVERALEGEMTAHLGYEKHASEGRNRKNSRNGRATKRVKTSTSEIDVEVPRDREGSFEPQLLPKRRRRLPGFDEKVLALYARGLTTRDIQGHLKEMYGVNVSPSLISAVTDSVMEDVAAWQSRPLDVVYPIVYLDALHIKVRENRHVQPCAVYVALGIGIDGKKDLLGLWIGESEGSKFWLGVLTELRNRGVHDILIAAVDGLKGFPDAIRVVFPSTQIQLCVVHMIRNSLTYASWKHRKAIAQDLRTVYAAATIEEAEHALESFAEKWDPITPHISRRWREHWGDIIPFLDYPAELRRAIYTTNAIESVQAQLRKVTKKHGAFPTKDSALKVLYLALMRAQQRWTMPIWNWPPVLDHLAIVFPGRVPGR